MSKEELLSALKELDNYSKNNANNARTKKIRDKFLMPKTKQKNRKKLYEIENTSNLSREEIKKIDQNLTELKESLFKLNKYYDDLEYKGIRDTKNLFEEVDEDYYKPIKTINSAFNNNYIEYESKGDKNKNLSTKESLDIIKPYLRDMINDYKAPMKLRVHSGNRTIDYETQFGEWEIQLTMQINFISSKNSEETRTMSTKSDNIEIMIGSKIDDIIKELCEFLLQIYQNVLEESMKGSEFTCDSVDLLYYHLHKTSLNRGGSYVDSPEWLKNKRTTINPKNKKDNNCFQYTLTVALNHQYIKKDPQRILKIKPFINQYNWKDIDFPSHSKDWKKFEQNKTIALNILHVS